MSEKVIVTKSKITNLADKARKIQGTSDNYTLEQIDEVFDDAIKTPTESLEITENGEYDVTHKASVNVAIEVGVSEESVYEELNSMEYGSEDGYTLTLNVSNMINLTDFTYSLDSGSSWNQFTEGVMTLENVDKIKFKNVSVAYFLQVGSTGAGSNDIAKVLSSETEDITITSDTTWYITNVAGSGGAD